jgi:hypothetical protein
MGIMDMVDMPQQGQPGATDGIADICIMGDEHCMHIVDSFG